MKFSIIVPVYNAAAFLNATVSSVLHQTLADWELLLVDDGSTDGVTGKLCDEIAAQDERIRSIHKPNGGAGDARNYGIDRAQGDYLVFLDSDDLLTLDALSTLDEQLSITSADICEFGYKIQRGSQETTELPSGVEYRKSFALSESPSQLLATPSACFAVWKRSLFTEHSIRFRLAGWGEDLAMTRKMIAKAERIVLIPNVLYCYVIREGSVTTSPDLNKNAEIMDALQDVLLWYQNQALEDTFRNELCALCVNNIYDACVRIVRADAAHPLLDDLLDFIRLRFPDYRNNPYLKVWPAKRKLIFSLLEKRHYKSAHSLFCLI